MANGQGALTRAAQAAQAVPPPGAGAPPGAPAAGGPAQPPGSPGVGAGGPVPAGPPPAGGPLGQSAEPPTLPPDSDIPGQHVSRPGAQGYQAEGIDIPEEAASPEENAEYERVRSALDRVLFEEDAIADDIITQLDRNDPVSTITKATALVIQNLDDKVDMDEIVIPQITIDAVDSVIELAENRFGNELDMPTSEAILGATWEAVMAMFGMDAQQVEQLQTEYSDQLPQMSKAHYGFLGEAQPGGDAAAAAAQPVPPTSAAQGPAVPMPPAGAPPTGGMPPAGGGAA